MKTALVAIIRNEAHDLPAWLAWHSRLGIDSFFIFDDGSDDGTLSVLEAASVLYDIRVFHIEQAHGPYIERQRTVYLDCLHHMQENFSWVGFLDADEYLALHRHHTIGSFLESFADHVGAVGIHLCPYGSNGHVLRPNMPPFYSFTRHGTEEPAISRHVKSFIRPKAWNRDWHSPHYFPLYEGWLYVTAEGTNVTWEEDIPGITATLPVWETARIMHFQTRSLEQFIERVRRHDGTGLMLEDFNQHDFNIMQDTRPKGQISACLSEMRKIIFQGAAEALETVKGFPSSGDVKTTFLGKERRDNVLSLFWLVPWMSDNLEVHGGLIWPQSLPKNNSGIFVMQTPHVPGYGFIFALDRNGTLLDFSILCDSRLVSFAAYEICPTQNQNKVALRHYGGLSRTYSFMTTIPNEPLIADRKNAHLWEFFELSPAPTARDGLAWDDVPFVKFAREALKKPVTLETVRLCTREDRRLAIRLLPLFYRALPKQEQTILLSQLGPFAPFIL